MEHEGSAALTQDESFYPLKVVPAPPAARCRRK